MKAASLETITIRPLPCALKVGSNARVKPSTPKKFVSITRRSSELRHVLQYASGRDTGVVHDGIEFVAGPGQYRFNSSCN